MQEFLTLVLEPFREMFTGFMGFAPNLLAMLTIFIGGLVFARIVRVLLRKALIALSFDAWSDRMGFTVMMRKGDMWAKPTEAVVRVIFWFLVVFTFMIGLGALKVHAVDNLVNQFFLYLPRVFSAVLILFIGYIAAGFLSRTALIALVNNGYHYAKLLAEAVRLLLIVLILAMALEQLHVAPNIVVAAFSILFGGIVIALAIAFGVGGIDAARRIIEKGAAEKVEGKDDIQHL
ncbi:MAG: mechanosensitive ion channel family protein [Nitrospirota bacterium]